MSARLLTLAFLVAAQANADVVPAKPPLKVVMPALTLSNLADGVGQVFEEHAATQLKLAGLEVVTARDMTAILGLERQRQLLGCNEVSTTCLTELGNALGADGVVVGTLAKVGARYDLNLKLLDSGSARVLAIGARNATTEEGVLDALTELTRQLAADALRATGRAAVVVEAPRGPSRVVALIPAVVGAVCVGLGIAAWIASENSWALLSRAEVLQDGAALRDTGQTLDVLAWTGLAVGGAALASAALLFFLIPPQSAVSFAVTPWGASASLRF